MTKRSVEQACGADTEAKLDEVAQGTSSVADAVSEGMSGIARAWRGSRAALTAPVVPGAKAPPREEWIRRFAAPKGTVVVQGKRVTLEAPDGTVVAADTTLGAACEALGLDLATIQAHLVQQGAPASTTGSAGASR